MIPGEVEKIIDKLHGAGFEAYIVGGCVRDFLLGKEPKDWDITTNAKPEEIQKVFPGSFYENKFLTVTAKTGSQDPKLSEIEITTYRSEAGYTDKRHPDQVQFAKTLEEDLSRRDFTVNAMALDENGKIIDIYNGKSDLKNKIIRTVGNADERFNEDALRMLRAVRFACTLGFGIEEKTKTAIKKNSIWLEAVSQERIRDEFIKIIMGNNPVEGIEHLRELNLLKYVLPELLDAYGVLQNKHHTYDCYWHLLKALEFSAKKNFNLDVRLASLLHDIGKPKTKMGQGQEATFYNHEIVGAKIAFRILNRLKFSKKEIEKIVKLVRHHLFYYNVGEVTESSVRRLIRQVGLENMDDLLKVRMADRIGSNVPKAEPYKLRHLKYVIEKVSGDPISAKMLKVNGQDIMEILQIKPGPKVGQILDVLLGLVIEDPKRNNKDFLQEKIVELGKMADKDLQELAQKSNEQIEEVETEKDKEVKAKYWVK